VLQMMHALSPRVHRLVIGLFLTAFIACVVAAIFRLDVSVVVGLLGTFLTFLTYMNTPKVPSQGGAAILFEGESNSTIHNTGDIRAGKGGAGGAGGNAIVVAPGVNIRITNHGQILGGDAGQGGDTGGATQPVTQAPSAQVLNFPTGGKTGQN